jgi:hypothetical protein
VGELLLRKLASCRARIEKIAHALPADAEQVLADERQEAFIAFHLLLLGRVPEFRTELGVARNLGRDERRGRMA